MAIRLPRHIKSKYFGWADTDNYQLEGNTFVSHCIPESKAKQRNKGTLAPQSSDRKTALVTNKALIYLYCDVMLWLLDICYGHSRKVKKRVLSWSAEWCLFWARLPPWLSLHFLRIMNIVISRTILTRAPFKLTIQTMEQRERSIVDGWSQLSKIFC